MNKYKVSTYQYNYLCTVEAESYEAALEKAIIGQEYKEVSETDYYDVAIENSEETKYFWIRSG